MQDPPAPRARPKASYAEAPVSGDDSGQDGDSEQDDPDVVMVDGLSEESPGDSGDAEGPNGEEEEEASPQEARKRSSRRKKEPGSSPRKGERVSSRAKVSVKDSLAGQSMPSRGGASLGTLDGHTGLMCCSTCLHVCGISRRPDAAFCSAVAGPKSVAQAWPGRECPDQHMYRSANCNVADPGGSGCALQEHSQVPPLLHRSIPASASELQG